MKRLLLAAFMAVFLCPQAYAAEAFNSYTNTTTQDGDEYAFYRSGTGMRNILAENIASYVIAKDAELSSIAGLTSAADKCIAYSGSGTAAVFTCTSYGRSLLNVADEAAFKALINAEAGTDFQAYDADLAALAGLTSAADKLPYFTGSGTASVADFTATGRSIVDDASIAAVRTTIDAAPMDLTVSPTKAADYTAVLTDFGSAGSVGHIIFSSASDLTLTVPANASVAADSGATLFFSNIGSGVLDVAPDGGVTLYGSLNFSSAGNRSGAISKIGTDSWVVLGGS